MVLQLQASGCEEAAPLSSGRSSDLDFGPERFQVHHCEEVLAFNAACCALIPKAPSVLCSLRMCNSAVVLSYRHRPP